MTSSGRLFSISQTTLRFLLSAWIGAAVLYVITSVAEQTSPNFESVVRDQLATIRFPLYYKFGFAVHGLAIVASLVVLATAPDVLRRRATAVATLIAVSMVLVTLDYHFIYSPLQELITPPGQSRTPDFIRLHTWSRHANEVHLMVIFVAAIIASLPNPPSKAVPEHGD